MGGEWLWGECWVGGTEGTHAIRSAALAWRATRWSITQWGDGEGFITPAFQDHVSITHSPLILFDHDLGGAEFRVEVAFPVGTPNCWVSTSCSVTFSQPCPATTTLPIACGALCATAISLAPATTDVRAPVFRSTYLRNHGNPTRTR